MTAIWHNNGTGWALLPPIGFADEAALHPLIEDAPQRLPLAGTPSLVVVGREVPLGSGLADLIAVEPSGRVVLIEVKLARNAEARRAVETQVLACAAYLYGLDPAAFEQEVLRRHLRVRGSETLATAVAAADQTGAFAAGLEDSLSQGRVRLVLVLDAAPEERSRLVGYLGAVSETLLIDLITVTSDAVAGSTVLVPPRIEPERRAEAPPARRPSKPPEGRMVERADDCLATIDQTPAAAQPTLRRLAEWALG
jgi:hypothetical protein